MDPRCCPPRSSPTRTHTTNHQNLAQVYYFVSGSACEEPLDSCRLLGHRPCHSSTPAARTALRLRESGARTTSGQRNDNASLPRPTESDFRTPVSSRRMNVVCGSPSTVSPRLNRREPMNHPSNSRKTSRNANTERNVIFSHSVLVEALALIPIVVGEIVHGGNKRSDDAGQSTTSIKVRLCQ